MSVPFNWIITLSDLIHCLRAQGVTVQSLNELIPGPYGELQEVSFFLRVDGSKPLSAMVPLIEPNETVAPNLLWEITRKLNLSEDVIKKWCDEHTDR